MDKRIEFLEVLVDKHAAKDQATPEVDLRSHQLCKKQLTDARLIKAALSVTVCRGITMVEGPDPHYPGT